MGANGAAATPELARRKDQDRTEVYNAVVEVLAAQVGVAGGGLHLEDSVLDGQQRPWA